VNQLKGASFSRTNHLDFMQTEIKGNTAWSIYYNSADMIIDGLEVHREWLESAVLLKEGKVWKVKLLHSTTLKGGNNRDTEVRQMNRLLKTSFLMLLASVVNASQAPGIENTGLVFSIRTKWCEEARGKSDCALY